MGMDTLSAAFSVPGVLVELLHDPLEVGEFEVTQLLPQLLPHSLPYLHTEITSDDWRRQDLMIKDLIIIIKS